MKKLLLSLLLLLSLGFLSGCALEKRPEPDHLALMVDAAVSGDAEKGRAAALAYREALARDGGVGTPVSYDELSLLARFLTSEAGDGWRTEELRLCAGEVLLNRVASPEFPDTLEEVLAGEGWTPEDVSLPSRACAEAALRLLLGERMLDEKVVYRSDRAQGGGVYATFCDRRQRFTYFCLTEHPELYLVQKDLPLFVDARAEMG